MKNRADYSLYECPYAHLEKECGHKLEGPEGFEDTYGVWCACGFRGPVFYLDPEELGLKKKADSTLPASSGHCPHCGSPTGGHNSGCPANLSASSGPEQTKLQWCKRGDDNAPDDATRAALTELVGKAGASLHEALKESVVFVDDPKDRAELQEAEARRAYIKWTDNQGIHCNRFPGWMELSEAEREEWRRKVCHTPAPAAKEVNNDSSMD